ncbi:Cytochrome c [Lutimaribacter saemankumensis]|uniref:Cytochrome c n=2 Tax=Lutimaribacter saemankumensis TaxID=490829 RepID=A0A1G8T4B9_9RHOB|nr:Cytochrome c [Lutimaribacter saemankumensis]
MVTKVSNWSATRYSALGAVLALTLGTMVWADEAGKTEYMNSCASCHGADGKGVGPVASALAFKIPKPLTGLAAANDGVFPMLEVIQIIDGRTGVRGHGTDSGMPVWGAVYKAPLVGEIGPYGTEVAVRGRILSLALYLESIQE